MGQVERKKANPYDLLLLPHSCAVQPPSSDHWVIVIKGMHGCMEGWKLSTEEAEEYNADEHESDPLGYDPRNSSTQSAMLTGSMFGWHVPGIDPSLYEKPQEVVA